MGAAMEQAERQRAKAHLVAGMLAGQSWREAAASAGLPMSRSAAYRLIQRVGLPRFGRAKELGN